jgi:DNA-directed RNA polymerase sigma subunit (sigma70/sigma32)
MRPSRSAGLLIRQFSMTRERIRQALRKLEHPSRSRKLRSFFDT